MSRPRLGRVALLAGEVEFLIDADYSAECARAVVEQFLDHVNRRRRAGRSRTRKSGANRELSKLACRRQRCVELALSAAKPPIGRAPDNVKTKPQFSKRGAPFRISTGAGANGIDMGSCYFWRGPRAASKAPRRDQARTIAAAPLREGAGRLKSSVAPCRPRRRRGPPWPPRRQQFAHHSSTARAALPRRRVDVGARVDADKLAPAGPAKKRMKPIGVRQAVVPWPAARISSSSA